MKNAIAIAGIHTGIGKTIAAAVITEALGADYWKPVQAGLQERDTVQVSSLITDGMHRTHPEAVALHTAISPHAAAALEGITIDYTGFAWPQTDKLLVVETAGGVLSPMTDTATMADFIKYYKLPTILVSQNYLGSINHTIASIEALKSRDIPLIGIVMNGDDYETSETFITSYTGIPIIACIPYFESLSHERVKMAAATIKESLSQAMNNTAWQH
jgi:dethiobiotin synthetase